MLFPAYFDFRPHRTLPFGICTKTEISSKKYVLGRISKNGLGNRFLRAQRIRPQRAYESKKNRKFSLWSVNFIILSKVNYLFRKFSCSGHVDFPASFPNDKAHAVISGASFRMKLISEVKYSPNIWKNPFSITNFESIMSIVYSELKSFFSQLLVGSPLMKSSFSSRLKWYRYNNSL